MSHTSSHRHSRRYHHSSSRASAHHQREILVHLRQAYFGIQQTCTSSTRVKVRFVFQGKNYTLSTFGRPGRDLITHLYQFAYTNTPRKGARSSTERITSSEEFNLSHLHKSRAKSSSSSSSSQSPSLVPQRRQNTSVHRTSANKPLLVRVDDQISPPRRSKSSTPVRTPTPDTEPIIEPITDRYSLRSRASTSVRRLFSTSSSGSEGNSGRGPQPANQSRAGQSLLASQDESSPSCFGNSQENLPFLWDTETIPVKVIYNRAGRLYERHLHKQQLRPLAKRTTRDLESFVDKAEENLVAEQLALEYYQAKRRPFAHLAIVDKPDWYSHAFNRHYCAHKLSNLLYILNQSRKDKGDSTLDNFVEYYWYLNHKGHSLYLTQIANREPVAYDPSVYRQKIIEQDIAQAEQYQFEHFAVHPRRSSHLSI